MNKIISFSKSDVKWQVKCEEKINFDLDAKIYIKSYIEQQIRYYDSLIKAIEIISTFKDNTKSQNELVANFSKHLDSTDIKLQMPKPMMDLWDIENLKEIEKQANNEFIELKELIGSYDK